MEEQVFLNKEFSVNVYNELQEAQNEIEHYYLKAITNAIKELDADDYIEAVKKRSGYS